MIDCKIVLDNPLVRRGFYFAKAISIETEPADFSFPKLLIKLELHRRYRLPENSIFSAILYPTNRSLIHYVNFFNTFFLGEEIENHERAIGEWGLVELLPAEFAGAEYSAVRFCYQPLDIRMESWRIERDERESQKRS